LVVTFWGSQQTLACEAAIWLDGHGVQPVPDAIMLVGHTGTQLPSDWVMV
jgi:hypothetical protein